MKQRQLSIALLFFIAFSFLLWNSKSKADFIQNSGFIFGTTYSMIYESPKGKDFNDEMQRYLLGMVDKSLSTFNEHSIISRINTNQAHQTDSAFERVFLKAQEISHLTNGAFDLTVAPLVNAWGFGYKKKKDTLPTEEEIGILQKSVGYEKVRLDQHQVIKSDPAVQLDASAIAKGYAVDLAAAFLEAKGVRHYMVEIGGEIRVKGHNRQGEKWRIGIDKPVEDTGVRHYAIDTVIHLTDGALATSGNYRQFYYKNGKRYSHTIDPRSGYPVEHHLLSASVVAKDCMTADALATAFMVMGIEKSLQLTEQLADVEVFLIVDAEGKEKVIFSQGMATYLQP